MMDNYLPYLLLYLRLGLELQYFPCTDQNASLAPNIENVKFQKLASKAWSDS